MRRSACSSFLSVAMIAFKVLVTVACLFALLGNAAPFGNTMDKKKMDELHERMKKLRNVPGFDADEYKRYWDEVIKNDRHKLDELHKRPGMGEDIDWNQMMKDRPRFGDNIAHGADDIRSRLEEARRMNVEELRQLQRLQAMRDENLIKDDDWMSKKEALREHLPPKFTDKDIHARMEKQKKILDDLDRQRHEEFQRYEMQMEHRRREKLQHMDEQHRLKAEQEHEAMQRKLKEHERLKHPASKEQLEEVWDNQDGLDGEKFDPKTFFHLHDKNGDKHLDAIELEALFISELKKVYKDKPSSIEAQEDLARMREHALGELDSDKDGMVSLSEFLSYTKSAQFDEKEEWKPVVEEPLFSEDEFKKFEENYDDYYDDYEYDDDGNIIGFKTKSKDKDDKHEKPVNPNQPHEPAKPAEHVDKEKEGPPPKIIQIDDPKAIHVDAAKQPEPSAGDKMKQVGGEGQAKEHEKDHVGKQDHLKEPNAHQNQI